MNTITILTIWGPGTSDRHTGTSSERATRKWRMRRARKMFVLHCGYKEGSRSALGGLAHDLLLSLSRPGARQPPRPHHPLPAAIPLPSSRRAVPGLCSSSSADKEMGVWSRHPEKQTHWLDAQRHSEVFGVFVCLYGLYVLATSKVISGPDLPRGCITLIRSI